MSDDLWQLLIKKRGMEGTKKEEAVLALIQFSASYPLVGFHSQLDDGRHGSENDRVSREQPLLLQIKIFSSYLPGVDLPVPSVRFLHCVISFNICSGGRVSRPPVINTHRRNVGLNGFSLGGDSGSLCTNIDSHMLPLIWHPYGMWRDARIQRLPHVLPVRPLWRVALFLFILTSLWLKCQFAACSLYMSSRFGCITGELYNGKSGLFKPLNSSFWLHFKKKKRQKNKEKRGYLPCESNIIIS